MRHFLMCACIFIVLTACSKPENAPTITTISTPASTITQPTSVTPIPAPHTEEQRIEEQLMAPLPTLKFKEGVPVRRPIGCEEGQFRGVDC